MAKLTAGASFTVPVNSGDYAPESITIQAPEGRVINRISVLPDDVVLPADYQIELWALKLEGDPATPGDYVFLTVVSP